jgi:hypothetical protein
MEIFAGLLAWAKANELVVVTVAFLISEALGAIKGVKANGILSLVLIKVQDFLKAKGAVDLTPND